MSTVAKHIEELRSELPSNVLLIAVSKTKPIELIEEAYAAGQRAFGENYVQEITEKQPALPADIQWHFIGHLQSNKVKYIAPFVHCIHAVDSEKLLQEIDKQAGKSQRIIQCLLQVHIADEESKFGFLPNEIVDFCRSINFSQYNNVRIAGLMGMASFTDNADQVRKEFQLLKSLFSQLKIEVFGASADFKEISMGMSGDWKMAIEEGSTMIRVGSAIFGTRN
jgi:pyridoxal phosphate enzyme (YggS family)